MKKPDPRQNDLFDEARARRDVGMHNSVEHAEAATPGWQDEAAELLQQFVNARRRAGRTFMAEDFVAWASHVGLADPPDKRAFGAVIRRGALAGVIIKTGYAPAKSSNLSPKVQWR